jgi:hypothetical protein
LTVGASSSLNRDNMCITLQVMLPFVEELALIYLFIFHQFDCTFDFFELLSTDEFLIKQKKKQNLKDLYCQFTKCIFRLKNDVPLRASLLCIDHLCEFLLTKA